MLEYKVPLNERLNFLKDFNYFLERGEEREKERERNINVWLPLTCPPLGTQLTTQACALTGNPTGDPLVDRPALNPRSHTSQGERLNFCEKVFLLFSSDTFPLWKKESNYFFIQLVFNIISCEERTVIIHKEVLMTVEMIDHFTVGIPPERLQIASMGDPLSAQARGRPPGLDVGGIP